MLTPIVHRNLFSDPVVNLGTELDRLFGALSSSGVSGANLTPPLDVWTDDDSVTVAADVPGFADEDIDVSLDGMTLVLRGSREVHRPEGVSGLRQERVSGSFERRMRLPFPVALDSVTASLDRGVLTVRLPKAESAKTRRIPVSSSLTSETEG